MNAQLIADELNAFAATPGIRGCALVEADSGLVWHAAGAAGQDSPLWEAAVDYWRLNKRMQAHFSELGDLGAAVMYHVHGLLVLLPCSLGTELLMVCIADQGAVDWRSWQTRVRQLNQRMSSKPSASPTS